MPRRFRQVVQRQEHPVYGDQSLAVPCVFASVGSEQVASLGKMSMVSMPVVSGWLARDCIGRDAPVREEPGERIHAQLRIHQQVEAVPGNLCRAAATSAGSTTKWSAAARKRLDKGSSAGGRLPRTGGCPVVGAQAPMSRMNARPTRVATKVAQTVPTRRRGATASSA